MNRKKITKVERQQVYQKYGGHCAYCGKEIEIKDMQVDHMIPLRLGGADEVSNYMPACRQCNHYKRGNSLEGFRKMIELIPEKLERDSYIYRVGVNYGNVIPHEMPIVFYFEIDSVCINPQSDWCDKKLFPEYDGCEDGRKSTLGISALQRCLLMKANTKAGE